MALFLAINLVSHKLTQSWKALRPKTVVIWDRINSLMSPTDNFAQYREATKYLLPPYIPCQEVILKDLLYHDCSIPDYIEDGVWNFNKLRVIGKMLDQFRKCQDAPFNFLHLYDLQNLLYNIPEITQHDIDLLPLDSEIEYKGFNTLWFENKTDTTTDSETVEETPEIPKLVRTNPPNRRTGSMGDTPIVPRKLEGRKKTKSKMFLLNDSQNLNRRRSMRREKKTEFVDLSQSVSSRKDHI